MMERRRALRIPFTVDKDNLMENPFRIPLTCVSSECGKFEKQVSWREFAGRKRRHCDLQHKKGSVFFGHNHAAKVTLEMARRKPCVILTDVLKTERGKDYLENIKQNRTLGNQIQVSAMQRERDLCKEEPIICRNRKSSQRVASNDNEQSTTSSSLQRIRLQRRLQNVDDDEVSKEEKEIEDVIIGKDHGEEYKFAEVVDCGLSVSWERGDDTGGCEEFSPASIRERWSDPEKDLLHIVKRKRQDVGSQCNGTFSPKRYRGSVLRLTGEDGRRVEPAPAFVCLEENGEDGREREPAPTLVCLEENGEYGAPAPTPICMEKSGEYDDLENLDSSIVQFTVGADDPPNVLVAVISPNLVAGDYLGSPRQSQSLSQDNKTRTSPSEPIVLSSDDEESCDVTRHCSPAVHRLLTVEDTELQKPSLQEAKQQEASDVEDMQLLHVVVEDFPPQAASLIPSVDESCMSMPFSTLHCGAFHGKSNGDIMIADQKLIIPLKDNSEQLEVILTMERTELRLYSVWEQQEMEAQELYLKCGVEPSPPAILLLCVSQTAAAAVQQQLCKLCVKYDEATNPGKLSPFILLTLKDPLEGMEGALFRSLLDIDCLNSVADAESICPHDADGLCSLEDFQGPVISLDDSIELIRRSGLDSHLLSLLGLENVDPSLNLDQDGVLPDTDKNTPPLIQLQGDSQQGMIPELETEQETEAELQPEEDQKEKELESSSEAKKAEPAPVHTLCHRRTKGSYSVSLCKPDSSWTKYRHQGLAHRLIQFPPPPMKGGITVTMEDLQCLDSGQFLNDVIIDFYLKYLLHKASAAVTERSHVFSSFFYKQLTRRDNAREGTTKDSCQRQRRHQRVKTWTRHVDIFNKDFVFVPVNQEAHWYLVVLCFPGLDEPKFEAWNGPSPEMGRNHSVTSELLAQEHAQGSRSPNDDAETPPTLNQSDDADTETEKSLEESTKPPKPSPVSCTKQTCQKKTICKRPCILVMDSLKRSLHERVFKLLRDYLESEWEVRRGSSRDFGADQMQSSHCRVPLQDNSSDCGLYLLQYVESFLKDPVVHFDLPLQLERWFPRQQVRRKRDEIRDLVLNLHRHQNLDSNQ